MVFYVCHGRVLVDISGVQFSAGKGCVFQVPRGELYRVYYALYLKHLILTKWRFRKGNYYSFANQHEKEARLFFTQGCVPSEGESSPQTRPKEAVQEGEFEPESGPSAAPAAKTRGRPKGKQKAGK